VSGPGKYSNVPRAAGPEFLAVWGPRSGYWRLAIYDRSWGVVDSVFTDVVTTQPRPGDRWLARLNFIPAGDGEWVQDDKDEWIRAVTRSTSASDIE